MPTSEGKNKLVTHYLPKMTGGDFTQEAYEALRSAYASELTGQDEQEIQGVQVMGQKMTMETLPVDSPWRDKIEAWKYPDGKSAYTDGPQKSPQEVLELMREAAAERDLAQASKEEEPNLDEMSDEELDALLDEVLNEDGDNEDEAEDESGDEDEEGTSNMTDEEFDSYVDQILAGADDDEEAEEEAKEEAEEEAEETEEVEEAEEFPDPDAIAAEIASLREELESLKFTPEE